MAHPLINRIANNWASIAHYVFRSTLAVVVTVLTFQLLGDDIGKSLHGHLYTENTEAKKEFREFMNYYEFRCQQGDVSELSMYADLNRIDNGSLPSLDRWHHSQLKKMDMEVVCFYLTSLKPDLDPKTRIK